MFFLFTAHRCAIHFTLDHFVDGLTGTNLWLKHGKAWVAGITNLSRAL